MRGEGSLRVFAAPREHPARDDAASSPETDRSTAYCVGSQSLPREPLSLDLRSLADQAAADASQQLVFQSEAMNRVVDQARDFARSSAAVLLTGESGTGKELIAHLIHQGSPRSTGRYVRVNCAALSESLMESELFGHERGAFTGAVDQREGRFEWADGGTLLLDEIGEIPPRLQAKLLRVLEEEEFQRVGGNATLRANARIIATTNRDLLKEVREGGFRADLYHRLNVLQIELPALRDRRDDVLPLAAFFLGRFRHEARRRVNDFDTAARQALNDYDWPGNVRQLRNTIHRACVLATHETVQRDDLPDLVPESARVSDSPPLLEMSLEDIERWVILKNLRRFGGNKTAAAAHLGVTARTLANKMKEYRALGYA
ncbi:MAG: sigma-54 dependent transcriptional regulator [Pirellulaceae bacterium]